MDLAQIFSIVNSQFSNFKSITNAEPAGLYQPIDYTMQQPGKRLRPALLMAANYAFGGKPEEVAGAAFAIEMLHNSTLVHDDIIDRSPLRRGMPTVYNKWDQTTAILSGDTMVSLAWRYLLNTAETSKAPADRLHEIYTTFNETAIGIYEGQQYDICFEQRTDVTVKEYIEMITLKTSVLLAGALQVGALFADAPHEDVKHLYDYGIHLGIAFQLQDDLLDAYGDTATLGKLTGQDIIDNKKTFLTLQAIETAGQQDADRLRSLLSSQGDAEAKIAEVIALYDKLEIARLTRSAIEEEFRIAMAQLDAITSIDEQHNQPLHQIATTLLNRKK